MPLLHKEPAPTQLLRGPWEQKGITLYVKREDLLHPTVSGNKWRKLTYNLEAARAQGHDLLLTFGGAFSNHIYATAAAAKEAGFRAVGLIRGEEHLPLNATLQFAAEQGMELHYLDRSTYRDKDSPALHAQLREQFGDFYLIPEGGSNAAAVRGVAELVAEIDVDFDLICCACGTGGTLAGMASACKPTQQVVGVPVLKGGEFIYRDASGLMQISEAGFRRKAHLVLDAHFGGYARIRPELVDFMREVYTHNGLKLDPVYTAKALYALTQGLSQGRWPGVNRAVFVHTGGLQGIAGMEQRHGIIIYD